MFENVLAEIDKLGHLDTGIQKAILDSERLDALGGEKD
jgi:hypothetical protein